jgi:hypothetical protein
MRHAASKEIDLALDLLEVAGLATCVEEPGAGRPVERWVAATTATKATTVV